MYFDSGYAFLNGPDQPTGTGCSTSEAGIEGLYNLWPELVHVTLGRNHKHVCTGDCSEPICSDYIKWYQPHAAGFFESLESYNGVGLRYPSWPFQDDPPHLGWTHGSVLQWIGAGGSFTWGRVNGPDVGAMFPEFVIANLYEYGMSWGEAIWSGIQNLGDVGCPIGDPLARVVVYDPDVVPGGVIDSQDVAFVIAHWGEEGSEADIDGDHDVDQDDLDLVMEVIGRDANALPPIEPVLSWPPRLLPTADRCGDLTGDGVVDQSDLAMFDTWLIECPSRYSGMYDVNHDGTLDNLDRAIIVSNAGRCPADVNLDECLTPADYVAVELFLGQWGPICDAQNEHWIPDYDMNCDGCIDELDYSTIQGLVKHSFNCPNRQEQ